MRNKINVIAVVLLLLFSCKSDENEVMPVSILDVNNTNLDFGDTDTQLTLEISNRGEEILNWSGEFSETWVSSQITSGQINANTTQNITITLDRSRLAEGNNTCVFFISSNGGSIGVSISALKLAQESIIVYSSEAIIYTMNADGSNLQAITEQGYFFPRISYDGTKVVCERAFDANDRSIVVMNIDGTEETFLTNSTYNLRPCWSRDGAEIVFMRDTQFDGRFDIYKMKSDGSEVTRLTNVGSGDVYEPSFSPDGNQIIFPLRTAADGDYEIARINSDGSNLTFLTDNDSDDFSPNYSANGESIVYENNGDGDFEIFIMDSNGSNAKQLTFNESIDDSYPRFCINSEQIIYTSYNDIAQVYTMDLYGENVVKLTNTAVKSYYADCY